MSSNMFVAFLVLALSVSFVSCSCDYNITSIDDLNNIIANDQAGWTSIKTLCFAAGTYTFSTNLYLTAPQIWLGPQAGVDPTCARLINPPCARYTSASTQNATVEAVLVTEYYVIYSTTVYNLNFTIDGFSIFGSGFYLVSQANELGFSVTLNNTYVYDSMTYVDEVTFDHCYFGWDSESAGETVANGVLSTTITNSFFYQVAANSAGTITAIGNTFAFIGVVAQVTAPSYFENNAFYAISNSVVQDQYGQTTFKNNLFWVTASVYAPTVKSSLNFDSNCFIDVELGGNALWFNYDFNQTNAVFNNNYFGTPYGPQIKYSNPSPMTLGNKFGALINVEDYSNFNWTYATKPLHFQAPNICPHSPFSLSVKPDNIKLGETVNITFSFFLHPLIAAAGVTPEMFDGILLQLTLYVADAASTTSHNLGAFAGGSVQTTLNPSTQSSVSVPYTFNPNELQYDSSSEVPSPPNYFLYYSLTQSETTPLQYLYKTAIYTPMTINPKVPLPCYNMSISINKNVAAGPRDYTFQQLGCTSSNWKIVDGDYTDLFSFDNYQTLTLTMGTNTSGVRLAHYQVSFYNNNINGPSNLVHNVVTKFTIVNHNPVINNATFTWKYPRTQQTFPAWNIFSNCSDSDGDTLTVVQIQRTAGRTPTTVVQLSDLALYFVTEKVVLEVLPSGQMSLTAPSNSNPVTAGSPLALFWKQSISFQFQITDGDIINQFAWGTANINFVN